MYVFIIIMNYLERDENIYSLTFGLSKTRSEA